MCKLKLVEKIQIKPKQHIIFMYNLSDKTLAPNLISNCPNISIRLCKPSSIAVDVNSF